MNRIVKSIVTCLSLIVMALGMACNPKESEATSYTYNYPAATVNIEFVDQKGNDFPITMGLEGIHNTATTPVNGWGTPLTSAPASISRVGGKNVFAFNVPAGGYTVPSNSKNFIAYFSNLKVNTPIPVIKSFSFAPKNSSMPVKDRLSFSGLNDGTPVTYPYSMPGEDTLELQKNGDHTFSFITTGGSKDVYGGNTITTMFGVRQIWVDNYPHIKQFLSYGVNGDTIRLYANFYQVQEIFEDQGGASIPAPTGYTNGNLVDITSQPFGYQMVNDSKLPKTYTDSGYIYTYQGWYKGAGNKGSMSTTYPPSINFNANLNESQNEVHIVYNKKLLRIVDEEYIDTGSSVIDSSWNNMGQQKADGDTFTQTPAATKTDSTGARWDYQGWKLGTEPMSSMRPKTTPVSVLIDANKKIQYVYKKKQHTITTKLVDQADGVTLIPKSGNTSTTLRDDNSHFWGYPTATVTDTGGGIWDYVGWENVTDAPGTINSSPTAQVLSIKGDKEVRYHYKARNTTATLDLNPMPQIVNNGDNVAWSSRVTNTGTSALNNLKLKATSNWASGLTHPTQVTVTPAGGTEQNFTVAPGDWTSGVTLTGISIPNAGPNNYADITFTDTATGAVNQVLPAEIELTGNMATPLTAENFVRIDDLDEPNLEPSGNAGFINIPEFRFGEVEVKPYAQTKGLDAASYQSGYNPYIRFKDNESTGIYSLAVKLSQFTSGSKTLPTTTKIVLDNGTLKEVQNYNKHNESLSAGTYVGPATIQSDSTTSYLHFGNTQGVYQLDYAFSDVELELMAHSGVAGLSYSADMDWTLTTAP